VTWLTTVPMTHPAFTEGRWHDAAWQHHAVMSLFGDLGAGPQARSHGEILFRVEPHITLPEGNQGRVLVQSDVQPAVEGLRTRPLAPVFAAYQAGRTARLLLVANTVRTINRTGPDGSARQHRARIPDEQLEGWLKDRLEGAATPFGHIQARPGQTRRGRAQIITTTYASDATIVDAERLVALCLSGIGRAKAYGCGLLTALPGR